MITLLTGTPGAGKSAYCVWHVIKEAVEQGRLVFCMGIPELQLAHVIPPKITEWTERRIPVEGEGEAQPYFTFPPGSLVVIDEAQRFFPTRPSSSRVPDHVAAFETHRHTGVDFLLMTQHPQLIDNNVRKLIGRHIHLRDAGYLGRWFYEWPECNDPGQFRSALVKKRYKLPKQAFGLYKSSSKHIKPQRSMPRVLVVFVLMLVLLPFIGYRVYDRLQQRQHPELAKAEQPAASSSTAGQFPVTGTQIKSVDGMTTELMPRIPDRMESAPLYDSQRQVKDMPQIVGCTRVDRKYTCYTQQGTKALVSDAYAAAWMAGDRPFNPFRDGQGGQGSGQPVQVASSDPQAATMRPPSGVVVMGNEGSPPWMDPVQTTAGAPSAK